MRRWLGLLLFRLAWRVHPAEGRRVFPLAELEHECASQPSPIFVTVNRRDLRWLLECFQG